MRAQGLVLGAALYVSGCSGNQEKHICDIEKQIDFRVIGDVVGTWSSMEPDGTSKYGERFNDNGHLLGEGTFGCGIAQDPLVVGDYNSLIDGFNQPLGYIKLESADVTGRRIELRFVRHIYNGRKEEHYSFWVEMVADDRMRIKYAREPKPILLHRVSKSWSEDAELRPEAATNGRTSEGTTSIYFFNLAWPLYGTPSEVP